MRETSERPVPVNEGAYSVSVHSSSAQFDALRERWEELMQESDATVFQSFDWLRTWWRHYGEQNSLASLHIVTVERAGRVVAIAPFFIESRRRAGMARIRQLVFIGMESTDYLDLIVARGHEQECAVAVASHIVRNAGRFDFVYLIDMPERLGNHLRLFNELQRQGFQGKHFVNEHCPRTVLQPTWEATLASFPSSKRASVKRVQKKILADFSAELQVVTDHSELAGSFREFIALHQRRWNEIGHLGVFSDSRAESFHREMADIAWDRHRLFLAFLLLNGERKAAIYGFLYRNEFFFYLSGIDMQESLEKYSLGRILHLYSMMEVTKRGVGVYDFMRGTERYKYDLNGVDADNWTIVAYPAGRRLGALKFKLAMLANSLQRRLSKERFLWRQSLKGKGAFSAASLKFIVGRLSTNIKDGLIKIKSPEKSLAIQEEQKP